MSEVGDAVQVIVVSGQAGYLLGKVTVRTAAFVLKLLNTVYLAKWRGRVSLRRMRQIKGEDYVFINAGTESRIQLKAVEKEMKAHGILYARLPDLCGGDNRTQYVIPASDAAKMKAFLLDHSNGEYKDTRVGPISPADYVKTGVTRNGLPTEEMENLFRSVPRSGQQEPSRLEDRQRFLPEIAQPEIAHSVRKHDIDTEQKGKAYWIQGKPMRQHDRWGMYRMPDGIHAVIIPREDMLEGYTLNGAGKVMPPQAAVCPGKTYLTVNLKDGRQERTSGSSVITELEKEDIRKENERLRAKNNVRTEKDVVYAPVQKQNGDKAGQEYTRITINEKMFEKMTGKGVYRTRIPYRQDLVSIPKSDCRMYTFRNGTKILSAYIYHDADYRIQGRDGEMRTVKGSTLRGYYDNRTKRSRAPEKTGAKTTAGKERKTAGNHVPETRHTQAQKTKTPPKGVKKTYA